MVGTQESQADTAEVILVTRPSTPTPKRTPRLGAWEHHDDLFGPCFEPTTLDGLGWCWKHDAFVPA
jgi:hypothetical protein